MMVTLDSGDLTAGSHSPRQVWAQVGVLRVLSVRTWGGGTPPRVTLGPEGAAGRKGRLKREVRH